jgi:hypothetical protein
MGGRMRSWLRWYGSDELTIEALWRLWAQWRRRRRPGEPPEVKS